MYLKNFLKKTFKHTTQQMIVHIHKNNKFSLKNYEQLQNYHKPILHIIKRITETQQKWNYTKCFTIKLWNFFTHTQTQLHSNNNYK